MKDLKTNYLGLELKNPVVIGANDMSLDIENIKKCEDQGAAAVVYKSLFEEQIGLEKTEMHEDLTQYNDLHAEMLVQHPDIEHAGPEEHLYNLKKTKESVEIPVIGSLNAVFKETWIEYAKLIEETGVDALELNFYAVPRSFDLEGNIIEDEQIEILKEVKKNVNIPVSVKLSPRYTNPLNFIKRIDETGIDGFVLFNRLFQPDINIHSARHITPFNLSHTGDHKLALRFAGLLHGRINASICSSTGIFSGDDVIKMILAGSDCVQIVSTLYKNTIGIVSRMISELNNWMDEKGYEKIDDFKGLLSDQNLNDPFVYKRAQYVEMLMKKATEVMNTYPPK